MGSSESTLIEVIKHLKEMTGRPVKVFAMREKDLVCESGVEYLSNKAANSISLNTDQSSHCLETQHQDHSCTDIFMVP